MDDICHCCSKRSMAVFYEGGGVPVHSVVLMAAREVVLNYRTRDIDEDICGLISNVVFDPGLHQCASPYEETQGFSSTFNAFQQRVVWRFSDRYDLRNEDIIEIGCGQDEFLVADLSQPM